MDAEFKMFLEICDCKEIQKYKTSEWKRCCKIHSRNIPTYSRFCPTCLDELSDPIEHYGVIYLPTIDQLIEILGDRLSNIIYMEEDKDWRVQLIGGYMYYGQSIRIALAKAVKETDDTRNSREA